MPYAAMPEDLDVDRCAGTPPRLANREIWHEGAITLNQLLVTAVVEGELPTDSIDQLVSIR